MTDSRKKSIVRVLKQYDDAYVPPPIGRAGGENLCFFNSMMAALHSIPTFNKEMIEIYESGEKTLSLCQYYVKELQELLKSSIGNTISNRSLVSVFESSIKAYDRLHDKLDKDTFDTDDRKMNKFAEDIQNRRQSDAAEGMSLFIQILSARHKSIGKIFEYRYKTEHRCNRCKKVCIRKEFRENVHKLFQLKKPRGQENDTFTKYKLFVFNLQLSETELDNDHICPICNGWKESAEDDSVDEEEEKKTINPIRSSGVKSDLINLVPEVMIIQVNHIWNSISSVKEKPYFPPRYRFVKKGKKGYVYYKLVAQIEHSGNTMGGHYKARCLRNGQVYLINDSHVSESKFKNTRETCLLVYHHYIPSKEDPYDDSHENTDIVY